MANIALLGTGLSLEGWRRIVALCDSRGHQSRVFDSHQAFAGTFDLGFLLNYQRIVPGTVLEIPRLGFVLFHSTDLPEGRGWAPIYETMTRGTDLVVSMLQAVEDADAGPILAKGRYPLTGVETEKEVRAIDDEITRVMLDATLDQLLAGRIRPVAQDVAGATWVKRRRPSESAVDLTKPLAEQVDHLRALPTDAPAYFDHRGRRFVLRLEGAFDARVAFDARRVRMEYSLGSCDE